jgi:SAM-dependent MidA family methyltransferase
MRNFAINFNLKLQLFIDFEIYDLGAGAGILAKTLVRMLIRLRRHSCSHIISRFSKDISLTSDYQ